MTDENQSNGNAGNGQVEKKFLLQHLFVKDTSYESPNSPEVFTSKAGNPDTQLNVKNTHRKLGDNTWEVILHITVHAKRDEETMFLVEIQQGGIFVIENYDEEETKTLMATYCLTTLFPYAREAISSLVGRGGFPPLVLQPINFDALYNHAKQETPKSEQN
jgi:preprotein translocase subunit SecB